MPNGNEHENQNREVLDKIKSLEETDKELSSKITDLTISMNRLAVSYELMQEAIVKLTEVKEQVGNVYNSMTKRFTDQEIRISKLEVSNSILKYFATGITTAGITSAVAYFF